MKKQLLLTTGLILTLVNNSLSEKKDLFFIENKGQVSDQNYKPRTDVMFSGSSQGMVFHIKNNGISYQLNKTISWKEIEDPKTKLKSRVSDKISVYRIDINWLNTNQKFFTKTDDEIAGYDNFYTSSCSNGSTNVKSYKGFTLENIYPNIDLHYYKVNGDLKYDYIVSPYADYKKITFEVSGAKIELQKNGALKFITEQGIIEEGAPIVYQKNKQLKAGWIVNGNILSFNIENYDPNLPLIIDPVVRLWGTYYGSNEQELLTSKISIDTSNNIYVAGYSYGLTGIATIGSHQSTLSNGRDAFLVKFNSNGVRQWGTYYGGPGFDDFAQNCCLDNLGNVYLCGWAEANATNVFSTPGCHQSAFVGSSWNGFLAKFDSNGIRLWGTLYPVQGVNSCAVDANNNVYIASQGGSTGVATVGAHQTAPGGGYDASLAKFNSSGVRQWGTLYGGVENDYGYDCTVDNSGNVYMCGNAASNTGTIIATSGSFQPTSSGGETAFLAKFDSNGNRIYGTYYGLGSIGYTCIADGLGNIYLAGRTFSSPFVASAGAHQTTSGGLYDAFLAKFNSAGTRQWGTYLGGGGNDDGLCLSYHLASDNILLSGNTKSSSGIATVDGYQAAIDLSGNQEDAFLTRFNSSGSRLWGTYYGGSGLEYGTGSGVDAFNNVFLSGTTYITGGTIIATPGSHQPTNAGQGDAFLVKFNDCSIPVSPNNITPSANQTICSGNSTVLSAGGTGALSWYSASTGGSYLGSGSSFTTPILSSNTTFYVQDSTCTSSTSRTAITVTVNPLPSVSSIVTPSATVCDGSVVTLNGTGASTFSWTGGVIDGTGFTPGSTTTYTVTGTDANGCTNTATRLITVNPLPIVSSTETPSATVCDGSVVTLNGAGASTFSWTGGVIDGTGFTPGATTTYTVTGTDANGCSNTATSTITVNSLPTVSYLQTPSIVCISNSSVSLSLGTPSGGTYSGTAVSGSIFDASVAGAGTYTITYTYADSNSCVNTDTSSIIVDLCTGVEEASQLDYTVYPNPSNGLITITGSKQIVSIKVYNSIGELILSESPNNTSFFIDITNQPVGLYYILIENSDSEMIRKILKN